MLCGEISQNKRGSLRGDPWRPCVIPLEKGNPSFFWIRGFEGERKWKERKEKERKGKKGKSGKSFFLVLVLSKRERVVRSSTLSLKFTEIGSSVFVGARGKVHLCYESFA